MQIDPIAFSFGPIAIRWYSLAYLFGILGGWALAYTLSQKNRSLFNHSLISDFIVWAILGVILGARLGYVIFYNPVYYLSNPAEIFALWHGGMSFHGGLAGVIIAMFFFAKTKKIPFFSISDIVAIVAPLGIMLGRIANFINGELYGKIAVDLPWAVDFAKGGGFPRHPSQLYEAVLEGAIPLAVFIALWIFIPALSKYKGFFSGLFLTWYSVARISVEFVREPDAHIGYILNNFTMGQILCLPVLLTGIIIIIISLRNIHKKG